MTRHNFRGAYRRALSTVLSLGLLAGLAPFSAPACAANAITSIATSYQPVVYESVDASGFKHPGVGLTRDILENMRTQVLAQKEPWNTHFNQMTLSASAARAVTSSNQSSADPNLPGTYAFNSQGVESKFIADGLKAYTQAILYYVTGDDTYRANALHIIRIWSQMDPAQYAYYNDAHIHSGIPLNRMVAAAEILRYTSTQTASLQWTEQDTQAFTANLITPVIETLEHRNTYFMNQHLYPLIGAMSGYIFTGNRARYNEGVEWFTVNKTAVDQGQNGAIKQLFRLVERDDLTGAPVTPPVVQHVEMGRDQAHGAGDLTNAEILARLLMGQGTKVDPIDGTASSAPDAVGPYEFLDDRILAAAEFFANYMLGYDTPWVPTAAHTDASGTPTIVYKQLASAYRGRLTQNTWELFYYYKYVRGVNIEQRAPNFSKIYAERVSYNWDGVDGGGDFWIFMPQAAQAEGAQYLVRPIVEPYRELEDRYTAFDANAVIRQEGSTGYVEVSATSAGTKIALIGSANSARSVAFRIRTNGVASMDAFGDSITLPDTKGQWKYVVYPFNAYQAMGDMLYLTIRGAGTTVQIDHVNLQSATLLSPPAFNSGGADLNLYSYAASSATLSYSFAATDSNPADTLSYQIDNMPQGAVFNTSTGAFSWRPTQAGSYTFVISVSDGATVTSKRVQVTVGADRQAAINATIAGYRPNLAYIASSLAAYNNAYADIMAAIGSASDDLFSQKLTALSSAVAGLQQLTPLLADGSMDYTNMFVSSTFGTEVPKAIDNSPDTFVVYTSAQNLTHTIDFGPSFNVTANAFQLQVRASFPERIGGVAIFGSNDKEEWTRLTPGLTSVTEDLQTLEVQDELKNLPFRFLKIQMIEPSSGLLELSEFHIFGQRHETVNQLSAVSINSDQALRNRIVSGDTVKLSFQATAAINTVSVTMQGQPASVTSSDNLNWTATWVANATAAPGAVKFKLNYKTAAGLDATTTSFTTDASSLYLADQSALIARPADIAALQDSSGRSQADLLATANLLFDANITTFTDFRLNGSGSGSWLAFDFKAGGKATLSKVEILARQDSFYTRIKGALVQGSNDNANWDTISNAAASSMDWQTLLINSAQPYRYIRILNPNSWFGNMAELRLHGVVTSANKIAAVSISSPQSLRTRIVPGSTVKLNFTAKEAINNVSATIQGQAATVSSSDNLNFTASAMLGQGVATGPVNFGINYKLQDGSDGLPNAGTTDSSALVLVDESDLIRNVGSIATLLDSTVGRSAALTLSNVNALFDANLATLSDFRIGSNSSGVGSYITFDFKSGNQATLSSVELAARQDSNYTRVKGVVIQGSNDNASWATLTAPAVSTLEWQTLPVSGTAPYRYIRVYNAGSWFGNMSELRLHGAVGGADTTPPVTTDNAPQGTQNSAVTVTLSASDAGTGVAATYFKVDGGAQQSGNAVTLNTEGVHSVVYWSVDRAGNAEPQHGYTLTLAAQDVSASVQMTQQGATLNRSTGKYVGSVSITNTSGAALSGPLRLSLGGLTSGLTLDNASGSIGGVPYIAIAGPLNPGASVNLALTFSNPGRSVVGYTPALLKAIH